MGHVNDQYRVPPPKTIREVPHYLKEVVGGFFFRLFYIFRLVWETRPWILFIMLFMSVFNGVMPVIGAKIGQNLLNALAEAFSAHDFDAQFPRVMTGLVAQFGFIFVNSFIGNVNNILSSIYGELVVNHIKVKIMNKAKEIDLKSFDLPEFYEKLENASREAGSRPIQIMNATFRILSTLISIVSFVVIIGQISIWAPVVIVLMAAPTAIVNFVYRRKHFNYVRHRSKDRRQMSYYSDLLTNKDMVKEIRMFGLSDLFIDRYQEVFDRYFKGLRKLFVGEGLWNIGITILTSVVNCALFLYIARGVCRGELQVGDYSLYTGALNSIAGGVSSLIGTTASIYEGTLFINNMIAFMKEEKTIASISKEPPVLERHCGHTIVFDHVSFRYPGTERNVINDVSLTLNAGDTAVLVGLNGAGKTTLIKLLTRLYDPTEGTIYLDGHDIREYDTTELYKMFGIIFQDFGKYAVSVTDNIAFGELGKEVTDEGIRSAAVQSNSDVFIDRLPDGYNTPLMRIFEENGIELSIGQWQKLSIARAFYSDSDILILDEPTASLDPMAEQEIYSQFDSLRKDKTTIFVSHRLSSATTANKVIVLENGSVIEMGSHSELLSKHGTYYELFMTQASRYIDSVDEQRAKEEEASALGAPENGKEGTPHGGRSLREDFPMDHGTAERKRPPRPGTDEHPEEHSEGHPEGHLKGPKNGGPAAGF